MKIHIILHHHNMKQQILASRNLGHYQPSNLAKCVKSSHVENHAKWGVTEAHLNLGNVSNIQSEESSC